MNVKLAEYRIYRSNALWFAARADGYSITVRDGLTFRFEKGEMKCRAIDWYQLSLLSWEILSRRAGAQLAVDSCIIGCAGTTTSADPAASRAVTDCICPKCTWERIGIVLAEKVHS